MHVSLFNTCKKLEIGFYVSDILSVVHVCFTLTLLVPETKIAEFANSVDLDEVAYHEPNLDLHCLPSSL